MDDQLSEFLEPFDVADKEEIERLAHLRQQGTRRERRSALARLKELERDNRRKHRELQQKLDILHAELESRHAERDRLLGITGPILKDAPTRPLPLDSNTRRIPDQKSNADE